MQLTRDFTCLALSVAGCGGSGTGAPADAAPVPDAPVAEVDAAIDAPIDAAPDAAPDAPRVCDDEARDDEYAAGMTKAGANGYRVVLVDSAPVPRPKGDYAWTIQVVDPDQQPYEAAAITVFPFMPDHHHGTSVSAVVTPAGVNAMYSISPVNLWMTGYWTIRLGIRDGTAELDAVVYAFCVD